MHWNGYYGRIESVSGRAACDGAILLQCEQLVLGAWMSFMMPGQKMDVSAFEIMVDVPCMVSCM